jgi:5-carboxymethyl-2-hydroxymuconate isomerase
MTDSSHRPEMPCPHCLIDAAHQLSRLIDPQPLVRLVHDSAADSGLFQPGEVKVRLSLYQHHCVGGEPGDFVHLIFYVLAGSSDEDKRAHANSAMAHLLVQLN